MFSTERVMAFCHGVGGLLMLWIFFERSFWPVILLGTLYSVMYVPTQMLSNSLAFQHLRNKDLEFPWVRFFGTAGFIVPAFLIEPWLQLQGLTGESLAVGRGIAFALSGAVGLVMGVYCLTLPHTPPKHAQDRSYAPGVVIRLLRRFDFLVLVVVSFFVGIVHKFFFVWNSPFLRAILDSGGIGGPYEQRIATIGQACELAVMVVLGFGIKRYGFKATLLVGAGAYALRCLLFSLVFSLDPPLAGKLALAFCGQALHGLCFGCFVAAGFMYVDKIAPPDVRGSMQTLFGTCVIALSYFVGGFVSGRVGSWFTTIRPDGTVVRSWTEIWLTCAVLAIVCVVALGVFFRARPTEQAAA
jgi:hypothetical protein